MRTPLKDPVKELVRVQREMAALLAQAKQDTGSTFDPRPYRTGDHQFRRGMDLFRGKGYFRYQDDVIDDIDSERWRQFAIVGCNGSGKTALMARIALVDCLLFNRLVIYLSASVKQNLSQASHELRRVIADTSDLDLDDENVIRMGLTSLPSWTEGRLYFAAPTAVQRLLGFHSPHGVTVVVDEAQSLDEEVMQAVFKNLVDSKSRILVSGNSNCYGTPFHQIFTKPEDQCPWSRYIVTAENVIDDPMSGMIAGVIDEDGVKRLRRNFGEESDFFQQAVYCKFPAAPASAFFPHEDLVEAVRLGESGEIRKLLGTAPLVIGVDLAMSKAGDETAVAITMDDGKRAQLLELLTWRETSRRAQVDLIVNVLERWGVKKVGSVRGYRPSQASNAVLKTGIGYELMVRGQFGGGDPLLLTGTRQATIWIEMNNMSGIDEDLRGLGYDARPWYVTTNPERKQDIDKYENVKAEAHDRLRQRLHRGEIGLLNDRMLLEELHAVTAFMNSRGKLQIGAKSDVKAALARSPDRADAAILALMGNGRLSFNIGAVGPINF